MDAASLEHELPSRHRHRHCHYLIIAMAAPASALKRWIRPEVYPLFVAIGTAVGLCGFVMARCLTSNPDVRINKADRAAGYLENFKEGHNYHQHSLRKFVQNKPPEIFASINKQFSSSK